MIDLLYSSTHTNKQPSYLSYAKLPTLTHHCYHHEGQVVGKQAANLGILKYDNHLPIRALSEAQRRNNHAACDETEQS